MTNVRASWETYLTTLFMIVIDTKLISSPTLSEEYVALTILKKNVKHRKILIK